MISHASVHAGLKFILAVSSVSSIRIATINIVYHGASSSVTPNSESPRLRGSPDRCLNVIARELLNKIGTRFKHSFYREEVVNFSRIHSFFVPLARLLHSIFLDRIEF